MLASALDLVTKENIFIWFFLMAAPICKYRGFFVYYVFLIGGNDESGSQSVTCFDISLSNLNPTSEK